MYDGRIVTDDFWLEVEPASGAVGDVVGVTVFLHSRIQSLGAGISMEMALCHDPDVLEIEGDPIYTDEFLSLLDVSGSQFYPIDESWPPPVKWEEPFPFYVGCGFVQPIGIDRLEYEARFPSEEPLAMQTVYYRIIGQPGDEGALTFCDATLEICRSRCNLNILFTWPKGELYPIQYYSESHRGSTVRVLEGPATHPDRPPEPPDAKIYPEEPTDEEADFRVVVEGAAARPGAKVVPVEVFISAAVEYQAVLVPIDFDERYLRLTRVEDGFPAGTTFVDNHDLNPGPGTEEGNLLIHSGTGDRHRIAMEGEMVHAATLYFDVLESAVEVRSTSLTVGPISQDKGLGAMPYTPWIGVRYQRQTGTTIEVVKTEIAPILIENGHMRILPEIVIFVRGDSNDDEKVDLSDCVTTLGHLFLGGPAPLCADAADANDDGRVDITDPIITLTSLFLEGRSLPSPYPQAGTDLTTDLLGCY